MIEFDILDSRSLMSHDRVAAGRGLRPCPTENEVWGVRSAGMLD